ncbi:pimeloyl-ACP methyl ester carboxylesterase [Lysobacter sp. OAE881]|uniref:alpha/beta fold hydrolase n=1 Tax=Lysobacter sp. OAE881 TaxID=2663813 RepID=UPI00178C10D9
MTNSPPSPDDNGDLDAARAWARRAPSADDPLRAWVRCAIDAYRAIETSGDDAVPDAVALANDATAEAIALLLRYRPTDWSPGPLQVGDVHVDVEFRDIATSLRTPLRLRRARDVPMDAFDGKRYSTPGFGVAIAALSSRDAGPPASRLLPQSGAFGNLTAWIEPDADSRDASPRLVLADALKLDAVAIGAHRLQPARDTSAAYAWAMEVSKLERLGLWGLVGGKAIGRRAGLYLLDEYDPGKCPLVMIHGLGSNPLIWSHVSNAVWGEADLRARFQVWQVVHQTDAPLLAARLHLQDYLDDAWRQLDPDGTARARSGAVLIGHSLGGVVARLLCADSGDALWNAAFLVPQEALDADEADLKLIERIFFFRPYAGVARAVFLAAPHRGSPSAATLLGRLTGDLVGWRTMEVQALRRVAQRNPQAIRPELLPVFEQGWINSITTLHSEQPVRRAAEALLPPPGFPYHTIAGVQRGSDPQSDGIVPLASAMLPGAVSSFVVESGHRVHERPAAVAEVVRILREHARATTRTDA